MIHANEICNITMVIWLLCDSNFAEKDKVSNIPQESYVFITMCQQKDKAW